MMYRTCTGCTLQGQPCAARELVKAQVKGLHVTSIRWKCAKRVNRFERGDCVWAMTIGGGDQMMDDGEAARGEFPAIAIRQKGSKLLVYIEPGAEGVSDYDDLTFQPKDTGHGFCKIPLSRIKSREGERHAICKDCDWPEHKGHQPGLSCEYAHQRKIEMCGERTGGATCIRPKGHDGDHDDIPF